MVIRRVIKAIKGHGYQVLEFNKSTGTQKFAIVERSDTKLRTKGGKTFELYDSTGWNVDSKCSIISEELADKMLANWGF